MMNQATSIDKDTGVGIGDIGNEIIPPLTGERASTLPLNVGPFASLTPKSSVQLEGDLGGMSNNGNRMSLHPVANLKLLNEHVISKRISGLPNKGSSLHYHQLQARNQYETSS